LEFGHANGPLSLAALWVYLSRAKQVAAGVETKYASEEIWRSSLALQREQLRRLLLSVGFRRVSRKERWEFEYRIERIWNAGLPDWQERDNAPGF